MTEHDTVSAQTLATMERMEGAINRHDIEAMLAIMTEDCVFENTFPAPDGARHEGSEAIRAAFEAFFHASPQATFETEECFVCGERAVVRWRYRWIDADGKAGHVRGVDLHRLRDGKIAETFAYVKG
jgi:uncharacterized protein (TIGR02246 family)